MTVGIAASLNWAADQTVGDYIAFIRPGDLLSENFIETAIDALERNRDFGVYVSQAAVYDDPNDIDPSVLNARTFVGEAVVAGSVFNYYSEGSCVCRTSVARTVRHRPQLGPLCHWGWMHDVVLSGIRVIASPQIEVLVRNFQYADSSEPIDESRRLHHLLVASSPISSKSFPIASLSRVAQGGDRVNPSAALPEWHRHMIENGYEGEIEFVASIIGKTPIGKLIRENEAISRMLEETIRRLTGYL